MQQGASREGQDEEILKLTICLFILLIVAIAFLKMQEERANAIIGAVAYLHILPFAEMTRIFPALMDLPLVGRGFFLRMAQAHDFLYDGGYATMSSAARALLLDYSGRAALVIYGPMLAWVAFFGKDIRPDQKYRGTFTLEGMIRQQTEDWVTARLARHVNPAVMSDIGPRVIAEQVAGKITRLKEQVMPGLALPRKAISLSPDSWSRALRPEEWLVAKGLVFDETAFGRLSNPGGMPMDREFSFRDEWVKLELGGISEVFAQQLRHPWNGISGARPIHQALFAVFALFYTYDIKGGNRLLEDLAVICDSRKGKRGSMDAAISGEPGFMGRISAIINGDAGQKLAHRGQGHAWLETAFPTFLTVARKDRGVLPSAAFLWLKSEDRLLWYILNNVGNEAIMIEAAGAVAHWRAECQIGNRIRRPAVFQAARSLLEDYLDQTPDRIESRRKKSDRRRQASEQIRDASWHEAGLWEIPDDPDGIEEE